MPPTPTPRHQDLAGRIYVRLATVLDEFPELGRAFMAPLDVVLRSERPAIALQPDVLFISAAREHLIQKVVMGPPDLVVEVVGAPSENVDPRRKRALYEQYGVQELWVVWPDEERVDLYTLQAQAFGPPRSLAAPEVLTTPLVPGFALPLAKLFATRPAA